MTEKGNGGAAQSGKAAPMEAFYWFFFTVWSLFFAWRAIAHHRVDLWPILAGLVASLATRVALRCFSPSALFTNTVVSLLAAALGGFPAAWMAYNQWHSKGWANIANNDLLLHQPWQGAHFLLCSYTGYLFFDVFDVLLSNLHDKLPYILLHHIVVLVGFCSILLYDAGFNYLILALICEVHSSVAYVRCLLRMLHQRRDGTFYVKGEWGVHWASYMTTRVPLHLMLSIKLALNYSSVFAIMDWPMVQSLAFVAGILGMNIWNVSLGFDLHKAFLREVYGVGRTLKAA
ncbi:hypothetical protein L7F22_033378 [Adiantum nelumboides]|nr:hypothetical protein [Adiantum nelumboides]